MATTAASVTDWTMPTPSVDNASFANQSRSGDPYLMLAVGLFISVDVVGILANIFVLVVLLRNGNKQVYEIFCTGLAITDLLFLTLTVPITTLQYIQDSWKFGTVMCKFTFFVINMTVVSSATMLLGLTGSRFLAVVHPWENRKVNPARAKVACLVAWIFGAFVSIPNPVVFNVNLSSEGYLVCQDSFTETQRVAYSVVILLFSYLLPFFAIVVMNCLIVRKLKQEDSKSSSDKRRENKRRLRTKVTKMVMVVTSLYGICWFPTELINFWYNGLRDTFPFNGAMLVFKISATALHYASCCVNPIVYSMLSGSFKAAIAKQFPTFGRRLGGGGGGGAGGDAGVGGAAGGAVGGAVGGNGGRHRRCTDNDIDGIDDDSSSPARQPLAVSTSLAASTPVSGSKRNRPADGGEAPSAIQKLLDNAESSADNASHQYPRCEITAL